MLKAWLQNLYFNDGTVVTAERGQIIVFVGPNNSGKSITIGEIKSHVSYAGTPKQALFKITIVKQSTADEVLSHLSKYRNANGTFSFGGNGFHEEQIRQWWEQDDGLRHLANAVVSARSTADRLSDCQPQGLFDRRDNDQIRHPFQKMYADESLEKEVSEIVRRAFKKDLVIHRGAGNNIPAYLGDRPKIKKGEDRISPAYLDRIEMLDRLEEQGDGVRSFVSVVARTVTERTPIMIIDEPEAFLHPPQAKLVGETIAKFSIDRQFVLATHSTDVLTGLLAADPSRVTIVRLSRSAGETSVCQLRTDDLLRVWRDPILRFSKIIDGIFHHGTIVAESDADCRFYAALSDSTVAAEKLPDIHYTYSGGKERIPTVVAALKALRVPVATIVDFDILNNEQPLRKIVEAHGGTWEAIEKDWRTLKQAVESRSKFLAAREFKEKVISQLSAISEDTVSKDTLGAIRRLCKNASPWDHVKTAGVSAIPSGTPTQALKRLFEGLAQLGVFVTPEGEMEGFCRQEGSHGPKWVEKVLERDLANDPELVGARAFVSQVVEYLRDAVT